MRTESNRAPNREQFLFLVAGGIILGLILVVVLFNMLGSSPNTSEDTNVRPVVTLPPQKGVVGEKNDHNEAGGQAPIFNTQGLPPLPEDVPAKVTPEATTRSDMRPVVPPPPPARPEAKVEKKPEPKAEVAPGKATAKPPASDTAKAAPAKTTTAGGRYTVKAGAFSEANATALKNKLAALGLPVTLQKVETANATLNRVNIGPYATRAEAETAARTATERGGISDSKIIFEK